jgi:hypothetical protein
VTRDRGLDFCAGIRSICRCNENRDDLHYRLHHYPLTIVGGAVSFIPD